MNNKKDNYAGPVEQEINSMMGDAGNEIMGLTQKGAGTKEGEVVQKIHIVNLSKCITYLAKEIDSLSKSIKEMQQPIRKEGIDD